MHENSVMHGERVTPHPQAKKALALLTTVNYFNYIDRFILSAVLVSIKADLNLSDLQAGLLATSFMISYMFTSPFFGWLGDTQNRSKLLAGGALLWSIASLMTGWAGTFFMIALSRFILGLGESAFTTISSPYISDHYPESKRGRALAIFSSGLPVGAALGFVLGGILGKLIGWRYAFFIVGFPGIILSLLILKMSDPKHSIEKRSFNIKNTLKILLSNPAYAWAAFGYCAYSFVVGGVAHWVPTYFQRNYGLDQLQANMIFGGIAVGSGLVGTLFGGHLGDKWVAQGVRGAHLKVSAISMLLSAPFFLGTLFAPTVPLMIFFLVFTQLFFFISTSPINVALIGSVPKHLQTTGMAIAIFLCHILGDAISSPLIGYISDQTGSLRNGLSICFPIILVCATLWFLGVKRHEKLAS
jgi:predicted MFS family arabinose efflux permease